MSREMEHGGCHLPSPAESMSCRRPVFGEPQHVVTDTGRVTSEILLGDEQGTEPNVCYKEWPCDHCSLVHCGICATGLLQPYLPEANGLIAKETLQRTSLTFSVSTVPADGLGSSISSCSDDYMWAIYSIYIGPALVGFNCKCWIPLQWLVLRDTLSRV